MICAIWASSDGDIAVGEAVDVLGLVWRGMGRLAAEAAWHHARKMEQHGAAWRSTFAEAESLLRTGWSP